MGVESIRLLFVNSDVIPQYLDGVSVRVFTQSGTFLTMAISGVDEPGVAQLELPGGLSPIEYQLRFYKPGTYLPPKRILVYSPASSAPLGSNDFTIPAEVFSISPAPDPLMCRAAGVVLGPAGRAKKGLTLTFIPKFNAFVSGPVTALSGRFVTHTDENGLASVDLYRFAQYEVTIEGREQVTREIEVPDRSTVPLSHLLFPIISGVVYEEGTAFELEENGSLTLTPHVMSSDYRDLGVAAADVLYETGDPSIASVQIWGDHVVLRGNREGTTVLRVTRADNSIVYLPDLGITNREVPIVVTAA